MDELDFFAQSLRPSNQDHTECDFAGEVRILIEWAPWQLLLSLEARRLSLTWVLAVLTRTRFEALELSAQDINHLLTEGSSFRLQLDDLEGAYCIPAITAHLAKRKPTAEGLELRFEFDYAEHEVLALIQKSHARH